MVGKEYYRHTHTSNQDGDDSFLCVGTRRMHIYQIICSWIYPIWMHIVWYLNLKCCWCRNWPRRHRGDDRDIMVVGDPKLNAKNVATIWFFLRWVMVATKKHTTSKQIHQSVFQNAIDSEHFVISVLICRLVLVSVGMSSRYSVGPVKNWYTLHWNKIPRLVSRNFTQNIPQIFGKSFVMIKERGKVQNNMIWPLPQSPS